MAFEWTGQGFSILELMRDVLELFVESPPMDSGFGASILCSRRVPL